MKKVLLLIFLIIVGAVMYQGTKPPAKNVSQLTVTQGVEEDVDYKAGFAIFTNGVFRIFNAPMYHNLSKDVFIQAENPNIVYVKKRGVTWDDFFKTLPFQLTKNCLTTGTKETFCSGQNGDLRFFLNGVGSDELLDTEIRDGDRALISFGNDDEIQIQKQFEKVPLTK